MLGAKIETSTSSLRPAIVARAPSTATAPTSSGISAATTLRKITSDSSSSIGRETISARSRSDFVSSLTSL